MTGFVLEAVHVSKIFPDPDNREMIVLEDVSLAAGAGEFVAIVGPSGGGKSTLLRLLAGLIQPDQGAVRFHGAPLTGPTREIGFLFQRANLMPWRTVLQNIMLPLEVIGSPRREAQDRARGLLSLVGLDGFANAYPRQLSGGMQHRVSLARALIHEPSVLLLDEPFGSLDALTRERMNSELLRIWNLRRPTVVMVTHSISEAVFLADRVLVMSPRPGSIRRDFVVELLRPRHLDMIPTPEFQSFVRKVRREIVE